MSLRELTFFSGAQEAKLTNKLSKIKLARAKGSWHNLPTANCYLPAFP
jgi:hypothetical protein